MVDVDEARDMLWIESYIVGSVTELTATIVFKWCPALKCYVHPESCKYCPYAEITCKLERGVLGE